MRQAWISTVNKLIFSRSQSKKCFLKIFEVWVCVSSVLRAVHVRTLHYTVLECQKQCHKCHTVCKPWDLTSTDREFTFLHFQLRRVSTAIQITASSHAQNLLTLRPICFDILVLRNIEKKSIPDFQRPQGSSRPPYGHVKIVHRFRISSAIFRKSRSEIGCHISTSRIP